MKQKSKIVIARIMAVLMMLSILPADLYGTANVVMAEELGGSAQADLTLENEEGGALTDDVIGDIAGPESIGGIQGDEADTALSEDMDTPDADNGADTTDGDSQKGEEAVMASSEDETKAEGEAADNADNNEETAEPSGSGEADVSNAAESEAKTYEFIPNNLVTAETALKENKTYGNFTLVNTSNSAAIFKSTGDNGKKYNGVTYNWRYQFGAKSTKDISMIKFTASAAAELTVCAYLSTDAERHLYLDDAQKDLLSKTEVKELKYNVEAGEHYLYAGDGDYCILYIKVTEGGSSGGNTGDNDVPSTSTIELDETTKAIISKVELGSGAAFKYADDSEGTPSNIVFKAEQLAESDAKITTAIKSKVTEVVGNDKADTSYYDMTLAEKDTDKAVALLSGTIKFKMPYPTGVTNKHRITVLHEATPLALGKITKEADGFIVEADSFSPYTVIIKEPPAAGEGNVLLSENCAGYEEGAYAEWEPYDGADGYKAYYSTSANGTFTPIDNPLIRKYKDYWRVDAVGLKAGTYYIKVEAYEKTGTTADGKNELQLLADATTEALTVTNYDRSGYAFSATSQDVDGVKSFGTGSGAYNDDGTLKTGAQIIYVTADTAKTCKATLHTAGANKPAVEVTGLQAILDGKQKGGTEKDILDIRIIGRIAKSDLDYISSKAEGLQIKGKANYNEMNITLEGIGEDAVVHGFGFLVRNCANVELRNFAIMAFMDDGVSLDTANKNIWVHDLDIFYGSTGGDSDQAKGDGSVDVKGKSTFITVSYNHFWDSGKCSLCGMSDSAEFAVTYHHNWFDHSDSRHPRIRVGSIHVYNNYFDGNSKYGVGVTKGSSAFVEANYFNNCKYPMLISQQASDLAGDGTGTFSGEDGGIIKAYNNTIVGAQALVYANAANGSTAANAKAFDAYLASSRTEKVPDTYMTVKGGTSYNNFDTKYDLGVKEANITAPADVPKVVTSKAGRLNGGDFARNGYSALTGSGANEDYGVDTTLKSAVVNYKSSLVSVGGIDGVATGSSGGNNPVTPDPGDTEIPDPDNPNPGGDNPKPNPPSSGGMHVHNFADGVASDDFFTISGNKQSKPTSFPYTDVNGNTLTLTGALKMESSTSVKFTAPAAGTLIIVSPPTEGLATKVDGKSYSPVDGIIEVYLEPGAHEITKDKQANIYYIAFVMDGYDAEDVSAPIANMASGNVPKGTSITLECATEGAKIYYTTDGSTPTASSTQYTTPISLGDEEKTVVVKAIAIKGEGDDAVESIVVTYEYKVADIDPNTFVAAPVSNKETGTVEKGTTIELSTSTEDAKIYYTTDETAPDADNGTEYTAPIIINETVTIWAIAIKGENESTVSKFTYTVSTTPATGDKTFEFNPQKEDMKISTSNTDVISKDKTKYGTDEYFTIANGSKGKAIIKSTGTTGAAAPDPSKSSSGITTYDRRFQFGAAVASTDGDGAIKFTTYGNAKVTVCAYLTGKKKDAAGNSTDEYEPRSVYLDTDTNKWAPAGGTPEEHTFDVAAGAHGIYAKDGDLAILYVVVEDTNVPGAGTQNPPVEKNTYTITVNKDNGTAATIIEVKKGEQLTKEQLPDPTRNGFEFTGWVDVNGEPVTIPCTPTGDMTIKATWKDVSAGDDTKYAITVDKADDTDKYTIYVTKGEAVTVDNLSDPARTGYKFTGWKDEETGKDITVPFTPVGNMQIKATWEVIKYTITVDKADGSPNGTITINAGDELTSDNFQTPSRDGYKFIRWEDGNGNEIKLPYKPTGNMTIKAKWEKDVVQCKVTIDKADGSADAITEKLINKGENLKYEDLPKIQRDGYIFKGWVDEQNNPVELPCEVNGDMTIKATWEQITGDDTKYIIVVDKADGSAQTTISVTKGEAITDKELPAPARKGHEFAGWKDGTGNDITLPYTPQSDMQIIAAWKVIPYTITVNKDNGEEPTTITLNAGDELTAELLPTPVKEGFRFDGWTVNNKTITLPYEPEDNIIVTAKWVSYTAPSTSSESWSIILDKDLYTYTGTAIKPGVTVYDNKGNTLVEGVDYTVKYTNNVKVPAEDAAANKKPSVTVSGKGLLTGKAVLPFNIQAKELGNTESFAEGIAVSTIKMEKGKKVSAPVICYNGVKLGSKDYEYNNNQKFNGNADGTPEYLIVKGQGNFTGTIEVPVIALSKSDLQKSVKKFKVAVKNTDKLLYSGEDLKQYIISNCIGVNSADGKAVSTDDYVVTLPEAKNAGSVKVMVVGMNDYSGCTVSKSVKIQPRTIAGEGTGMDKVTVSSVSADTSNVFYSSTGASLSDLKVTWNDIELTNGKDYKVAYSANKKVGQAKYTISFIGNFKGKLAPKTFNIKAVELKNNDANVKVEVEAPDKVCKDNAGCKSVPYVTINGVLVKASEYSVEYSTDGTNYSATAPKASFKGAASQTIYVRIKSKPNKNFEITAGSEPIGQYTVWDKTKVKPATDLSKAKVTFYDNVNCTGNKVSKFDYTGEEVKPAGVKVEIGGKKVDAPYDIIYVGNVNKGKATVIVKPKDGSVLTGSKTATFTITPKKTSSLTSKVSNIDVTNMFKNLFK